MASHRQPVERGIYGSGPRGSSRNRTIFRGKTRQKPEAGQPCFRFGQTLFGGACLLLGLDLRRGFGLRGNRGKLPVAIGSNFAQPGDDAAGAGRD